MDLSGVITSLATGTYTVTRCTAVAYTDGRLGAPTTSTFTITGCVQPLGGRELQRLPEGLREAELLQIFTPTELRTAAPGLLADSVAINGGNWEVQSVERWQELGAYWRAVVSRKGHG